MTAWVWRWLRKGVLSILTFWHFWLTFVHVKRNSLGSQYLMTRLLLWFSNTMLVRSKEASLKILRRSFIARILIQQLEVNLNFWRNWNKHLSGMMIHILKKRVKVKVILWSRDLPWMFFSTKDHHTNQPEGSKWVRVNVPAHNGSNLIAKTLYE